MRCEEAELAELKRLLRPLGAFPRLHAVASGP
jgi:hypothetical protein